MKRLPSLLGALVVTASLAACADSPTQVNTDLTPSFALGTPGTCPGGRLTTTKGKAMDANGNGYICAYESIGKNGRKVTNWTDDVL